MGGRDATIVALTRPEDESIKLAVREAVACFASLNEPSTVIIVPKAKENLALLSSTTNAIGMVNTVQFDDAAGKLIAPRMDGKETPKAPTASWPIQQHFNLVVGKMPTVSTKRFMQFVASPEGQTLLRKEKVQPVPFKL